jgi:phosphopantothenoylcysteine decarboxylase/phosphopantothenate--cysteine ligase
MVTAGPTREALDPVRFITNHSTGKMGYAIARMAMLRGAEVTLVSGPVSLAPVPFVRIIDVISAQDMFEAVRDNLEDQDALIKAAAVADYRPAVVSDEKVKKSDSDMSISLERTQDILQYVSAHRRPNQVICGFSMETMNMIENSRKKLKKKNLDMIIANNLKEKGAGFGTDTNRVTIISKEGERELELLTKEEVADEILNEILARKSSGGMNGL